MWEQSVSVLNPYEALKASANKEAKTKETKG